MSTPSQTLSQAPSPATAKRVTKAQEAEWVYDNIGATEDDAGGLVLTSDPPRDGTIDLLMFARSERQMFFKDIWAPLLKAEYAREQRSGGFTDDNRDLSAANNRILVRTRDGQAFIA